MSVILHKLTDFSTFRWYGLPGAGQYTQRNVDAKIDAGSFTTNYPIPEFDTPRSYWYTSGPKVRYVGMSEFTAQNFVCVNSEFSGSMNSPSPSANAEFPLPSANNVDGTQKRIVAETATLTTYDNRVITRTFKFVKGKVYDEFTGASPEIRLAHVSFAGGPAFAPYTIFAEDNLVFDDEQKILFPRVIAFSAGLINHFFRGDITLARGTSNTQGEWVITNSSPYDMTGTFRILSEDAAGVRSAVTGPAFTSLTGTIPSGGNVAVQLTEPPPTTAKLIVVFRGQIGSDYGATGIVNPTDGYVPVTGRVMNFVPLPGLVADKAVVVVPTSGGVSTLAVKLSSAPKSNVIVTIARASGASAITATPATLTFTPANYANAQTVAFSGPVDPASDLASTFTLASPGIAAPLSVSVTEARKSIPCGSAISATGGSKGFSNVMDLGNMPGAVNVEFEAYSIPDSLSISAAGFTTISTNGLVSGYHAWSFNHTGTPRYVNVNVTGNSDLNTGWMLSVSCPNANAKPLPQVNVWFGSRPQTACGVTCTTLNTVGSFSFKVNSTYTVGGLGMLTLTTGKNVQVDVTYVPPSWGWPNGTTSGTGIPTYRDGAGTHDLNFGTNWISIQ